jgi:hypothetical protein
LVGDVGSLVAGEVALPDDVDGPVSVGVVEVVGLTGPGVIPELLEPVALEPLVDPVAPALESGSEPVFVLVEPGGAAAVEAAALAEASDCMVALEALASIA